MEAATLFAIFASFALSILAILLTIRLRPERSSGARRDKSAELISTFDAIIEARDNAPADLVKLASRMGIDVRARVLAPDCSGALVREGDRFVIIVNARDSDTRRRFTIAHQLGHFFYHRDLIDQGANDNHSYRQDPASSYYSPRLLKHHETQANRFAINLVMPYERVHEMLRAGLTPAEIAQRLEVSEAAMKIRTRGMAEVLAA